MTTARCTRPSNRTPSVRVRTTRAAATTSTHRCAPSTAPFPSECEKTGGGGEGFSAVEERLGPTAGAPEHPGRVRASGRWCAGSGIGEPRPTMGGDSVETGIGRRPARTGRARFGPVAQPALAQSWGDAPAWMRCRALRGGCADRHPARDSRARDARSKAARIATRGRLVQRSPRIRWVERRRGIGKSGEAHRVGCDRVSCAPGKNAPQCSIRVRLGWVAA